MTAETVFKHKVEAELCMSAVCLPLPSMLIRRSTAGRPRLASRRSTGVLRLTDVTVFPIETAFCDGKSTDLVLASRPTAGQLTVFNIRPATTVKRWWLLLRGESSQVADMRIVFSLIDETLIDGICAWWSTAATCWMHHVAREALQVGSGSRAKYRVWPAEWHPQLTGCLREVDAPRTGRPVGSMTMSTAGCLTSWLHVEVSQVGWMVHSGGLTPLSVWAVWPWQIGWFSDDKLLQGEASQGGWLHDEVLYMACRLALPHQTCSVGTLRWACRPMFNFAWFISSSATPSLHLASLSSSVVPLRTTSPDPAPLRPISFRLVSPRLTSSHLASPRSTSFQRVRPHPTSFDLVLHRPISAEVGQSKTKLDKVRAKAKQSQDKVRTKSGKVKTEYRKNQTKDEVETKSMLSSTRSDKMRLRHW